MLKVGGMPELQAAALLFKNADAPIKRAIQRESREWGPTLIRAVQARAHGAVERRIANSGKASVTNRGPKATFGSGGKLSSGEPLGEVTRPYEFGTSRHNVKVEYLSRHRISGRAMRVKRRTMRQLPAQSDEGRFVYQGLADATPELVGRYVKAIAEAVSNA